MSSGSFTSFLRCSTQTHTRFLRVRQCQAEQSGPFPHPAGSVGPYAPIAHCWLRFNLLPAITSRSLSNAAAHQHLIPVCMYSQDCPILHAAVKLHAVAECPAFQFVKISLQCRSTLKRINKYPLKLYHLLTYLVCIRVLHPDHV